MKHFLQHISDLLLISKPCAHSAQPAPFYFPVKNARNERPLSITKALKVINQHIQECPIKATHPPFCPICQGRPQRLNIDLTTFLFIHYTFPVLTGALRTSRKTSLICNFFPKIQTFYNYKDMFLLCEKETTS
jgi:hypothetical protein